jgi:hypothetical protein
MKGKLHGSVKALEGYIAFHRLLILFCEKYPDLMRKVNEIVGNFIQSDSSRNKRAVPDLGEFMALLSVSSYSWEDVSTAYLTETFVRNVRWVVQKYPELNTYTPNTVVDKNRLSKTFLSSITSMQLMLYNVYFLENIGRPKGQSLKEVAAGYDALYGHSTNLMKEKFLQCITEVRIAKDYKDVFKRIGVAIPTDLELVAWMRSSVKKSLEQNYHNLDSDGIRVSSSSSGVPRGNSGNKLNVSSSNSPTRTTPRGDKGEKIVCRDWEKTGTCPRDKCRFAHPPLRKR